MSSPGVIDAHCHLGFGLTCSRSADDLLKEMDGNNVARAVIVPVDRFLAVDNSEGNDQILAAARSHPERLIPFTTANPWFGERARAELTRTFAEGSAGVKFHPGFQGFTLSDDVFLPLVELAVEHGKPMFFHAGTPISSMPYQFTELAMRYPEGIFIMGHMAYSDFWYEVSASAACVDNLYLETSHHVPGFVRTVTHQVGVEKILFGSDSPYGSMEVELEKIRTVFTSESDCNRILSANLQRILEAS
jgi:predicted TIM-barrel fold metal-dependent hydrolase